MNKNYDLIIVGAGLAGFAAAAEAADADLKTLLVEKGQNTGGTGNYVEGVFAADSAMQKEAGEALDPEALLKEELEYSHYRADGRMWQKYIANAGKNVDWLKKRGVEIPLVSGLGSGAKTWHLFKGKGHDAIHKGLEPYALDHGVELRKGTAVTAIGTSRSGYELTLTNVKTQDSELVYATNVVLATGGYLNNRELLEQTPHQNPNNIIPVNSGLNTGDGLKLAWSLGGKKFFTGMAMMFGGQLKDLTVPAYKLWGTAIWSSVCDQPQMWVNETGARFVDESAAVVNWANEGNSMNRQDRVFCIFSQQNLDDLTDKKMLRSLKPFIKDENYPTLRDDLKKAEAEGRQYLYKADSLAELAEKIDAPDLVKNVEHYNEMTEQGEDTEFHKDAKYLAKITGAGPYYAIELGVGAYTTGDGLRVNCDNVVLDERGHSIDGLYAVGGDGSAVLYGDTYGVNVPGTHAGYCVFSGRNAVQAIAKNN